MQIDVQLDPRELAALEREVAVLLPNEPGVTPEKLVARMAKKAVRGWADIDDQKIAHSNAELVRQVVVDLSADPERDEKLAALGIRVDRRGAFSVDQKS